MYKIVYSSHFSVGMCLKMLTLVDSFLEYILDVLPNYLHLCTHLLELSLYISLCSFYFFCTMKV